MTFGVFSLSIRGVFWTAPTPSTNTYLSVLQFVAKIHESLIILSLTAIVFHRIRYEILAGDGIPFGLLSSGLQYNSWFVLARSDFRAAITRRHAGLIGIFVLSFLLAATSGPAAAIASCLGLSGGQFRRWRADCQLFISIQRQRRSRFQPS